MKALASRFASLPVMISPDKADWASQCLEGLSAVSRVDELMSLNGDDDDFWPSEDSWLASYRPYSVKDGTLQIPVKGLLLHDFGWQLGDWATGYTYIERAFLRGMDDPAVERIALMVNSGGGEVAGNFDMVDRMYSRRDEKPVMAVLNEHAYSAAYSIATVASEITVPRTGGAGSIGVVTSHVDLSKAMEKQGVKITFIQAGEHKTDGNPYAPLDEEAKNRMQARIDSLYDIFVNTVARNRGISEEVVRGTQALCFSASEAVELGLVDRIASSGDALAAFTGGTTQNENEVFSMSNAIEKPAITAAELEAARAEGAREGATAERVRIEAILGSAESANRRDLAFHLAMKTDLTVEGAKAILGAAPEVAATSAAAPTQNAFAQAMNSSANPEVGEGSAPVAEASTASKILADFHAFTGAPAKH